jgi:hypothetical protein
MKKKPIPSTNTKDTLLRSLEQIVYNNTDPWLKTVDYDGIGVDVIKLINKLKRKGGV